MSQNKENLYEDEVEDQDYDENDDYNLPAAYNGQILIKYRLTQDR